MKRYILDGLWRIRWSFPYYIARIKPRIYQQELIDLSFSVSLESGKHHLGIVPSLMKHDRDRIWWGILNDVSRNYRWFAAQKTWDNVSIRRGWTSPPMDFKKPNDCVVFIYAVPCWEGMKSALWLSQAEPGVSPCSLLYIIAQWASKIAQLSIKYRRDLLPRFSLYYHRYDGLFPLSKIRAEFWAIPPSNSDSQWHSKYVYHVYFYAPEQTLGWMSFQNTIVETSSRYHISNWMVSNKSNLAKYGSSPRYEGTEFCQEALRML